MYVDSKCTCTYTLEASVLRNQNRPGTMKKANGGIKCSQKVRYVRFRCEAVVLLYILTCSVAVYKVGVTGIWFSVPGAT